MLLCCYTVLYCCVVTVVAPSPSNNTELYCTVLYCTVLYCCVVVLCCTAVLHCCVVVLCCTAVLHCCVVVLCCTVVFCPAASSSYNRVVTSWLMPSVVTLQ